MGVKFKANAYLAAVNAKSLDQIKQQAQEKPQFSYGQVTLGKFSQKYRDNGWFGRKIVALPKAAWCGTVKVVYHLALAIIGLLTAPFDQARFFKKQLFSIPRDVQEAVGRAITFFNDRVGQFLVQGSQFHKSCYDCFTLPKHKASRPKPGGVPRSNHPTTHAPKHVQENIRRGYKLAEEGDKIAKELEKSLQKDEINIFNQAKKSIRNNNLGEAVKWLGRQFGNPVDAFRKTNLLLKIIRKYIAQGEMNLAFETIKKMTEGNDGVSDQKKSKVVNEFLKACLDKKQFALALEMLKWIPQFGKVFVFTESDTIAAEVVERFISSGKHEAFFEAVKNYPSPAGMGAFMGRISEAFLKEKKPEKAYKAMLKLGVWEKQKKLVGPLIEGFLDKGELDKAYEIYDKYSLRFKIDLEATNEAIRSLIGAK